MSKTTKEFSEHDKWMVQRLVNKPKLQEEYIKALMEDAARLNNEQPLLRALKQVAKAQGISKVATAAGIHRESLSRALSERGNPRIDTLLAIVHAMGLELTVKPISAH